SEGQKRHRRPSAQDPSWRHPLLAAAQRRQHERRRKFSRRRGGQLTLRPTRILGRRHAAILHGSDPLGPLGRAPERRAKLPSLDDRPVASVNSAREKRLTCDETSPTLWNASTRCNSGILLDTREQSGTMVLSRRTIEARGLFDMQQGTVKW